MSSAPQLESISGLTTEQLKLFADFIEKKTGIVYSDSNMYQLENRLLKVAQAMLIPTMPELWKKAQMGISGLFEQVLLDIATNNETSFFRDKHIFDRLLEDVFPKLTGGEKALRPCRIWSAACSTGQEPYSIMMAFKELADKALFPYIEMHCTDFSERVLEKAKSGIYTQLEVQRGLPAKLLIRYFKKTPDDMWVIDSGLRHNMSFERMNLLDNWPERGKFDIVLCRNVLIYQSVENKKKVIEKIAQRLNPKGFLVLGGAESMMGLSDRFNQVSFQGAVFFQKKD